MILAVVLLLGQAAPAAVPPPAAAAAPADDAEMARLFADDQAIRQDLTPARFADKAFMRRFVDGDRARLKRTRALLDEGRLRTGADFYHAAFLFQHGDTADDYLLAHALAIAATARGHPRAAWIAAATLDRFLQTTGRPQVYGTQYGRGPDGATTLEPYDRALVPDGVRQAAGVPPIPEQERRLGEMGGRLPPAPSPRTPAR